MWTKDFYLDKDGNILIIAAIQDNAIKVFSQEDIKHYFTLVNYTGFKDQKGKEIYDNDFVKIVKDPKKWTGNEPISFKYGDIRHISYDSKFSGWRVENTESEIDESIGNYVREGIFNFLEVIGNSFENQELYDKQ